MRSATRRAIFAPSRCAASAHDARDLRLRERLEVHRGAARADRGVDRVGIARRRADQHEVGRRAVAEQLLHVGGHVRIVLVVVRRLERDALVLEHLEQPRLHRRVHLADLVDEQHAAVRARHQAQLRLGDRAVGEVAPRALVDRVVHAAQQRVRRLAVIPAQRRAGRFDERRVGRERRVRARLRHLEREPRDRRLADAGRAVQDHVLRIRRRELRDAAP